MVLKNVEEEIKKLCSHVPKQIQTKEIELTNEDRRLVNFIEFIAEGRKSEALSKALEETEKRVNALQAELNGLRNARDTLFETPPIEWIEAKLENAKVLLKGNFAQAGEALREFLGPITLEAIYPDIGKPYFIAQSSINTITLLENSRSETDTEDGSTTLRWWTWTVRIRTIAKIPIEGNLLNIVQEPTYQKIASKSLHLKELGFSNRKIANHLNVDEKTVSKAITWMVEKNSDFSNN